jgi:hypothetical protein
MECHISKCRWKDEGAYVVSSFTTFNAIFCTLAGISLLPNRSGIWQLYTAVEVCQVNIAVFTFA